MIILKKRDLFESSAEKKTNWYYIKVTTFFLKLSDSANRKQYSWNKEKAFLPKVEELHPEMEDEEFIARL